MTALRDMDMQQDDSEAWDELPEPEVLPVCTMLEEFDRVNVLAPLVRCSKLPFRHLVSLYETHVTHTPMILAEEFSRSQSARTHDFTTSNNERGVFWMEPKQPGDAEVMRGMNNLSVNQDNAVAGPSRASQTYYTSEAHNRLPPTATPPTKHSRLVRGALMAQMTSPNAASLADAAELVAPHVDGLDINCGCPQSWAYKQGVGCALLRKPELVADMVRTTKDRLGFCWPVSIKIRIDSDTSHTAQLVQNAIKAGVSHITVHGRTRHQASTEAVNVPGIKTAVELINGEVSVVANGDIWSYEDAETMRTEVGTNGIMAARGLLANPALFAGYKSTPASAVENFVNVAVDYGLIFSLFHRHVAYMLEGNMYRPEKTYFNALGSTTQIVEYLQDRGLNFDARRQMPMWDARRGYRVL